MRLALTANGSADRVLALTDQIATMSHQRLGGIMQVIGLCRFSYPAIGGFQVEHEDIASREAFLYAPERIDERFQSFEALTLPGLRAQTDPDFTFLVVIGDKMPPAYLARLKGLLSDLPQAVLIALPAGRQRQVMAHEIRQARLPSDQPSLQFRLDDDDAVAVDFVAELRQVARDCSGLMRDEGSFAIDFNQGWEVRIAQDGLSGRRVQQPYWTPALGMAVHPDKTLTVMNFSHHKLFQAMPTVTMTGVDMYLRGVNWFNDSRFASGKPPPDLPRLTVEEEQGLCDRFAISGAQIRQLCAH